MWGQATSLTRLLSSRSDFLSNLALCSRRTLQPAQLEPLGQGLKEGPETLGYGTSLWTTWRVADLIERQTGQKFHPGHVWRILRSLGWSCQRPVGRATQRDEVAIRRWKQVRWPEIKKKPNRSSAP